MLQSSFLACSASSSSALSFLILQSLCISLSCDDDASSYPDAPLSLIAIELPRIEPLCSCRRPPPLLLLLRMLRMLRMPLLLSLRMPSPNIRAAVLLLWLPNARTRCYSTATPPPPTSFSMFVFSFRRTPDYPDILLRLIAARTRKTKKTSRRVLVSARTAELRNVVQEKNGGRGASSRGFVPRIAKAKVGDARGE